MISNARSLVWCPLVALPNSVTCIHWGQIVLCLISTRIEFFRKNNQLNGYSIVVWPYRVTTLTHRGTYGIAAAVFSYYYMEFVFIVGLAICISII
jgi:hypothetical protein